MNRRKFLAALALAPVAGVVAREAIDDLVSLDGETVGVHRAGHDDETVAPMTAREVDQRMRQWYEEAYAAAEAEREAFRLHSLELYNREVDRMILAGLQRT